ncbi:MAG: cupin domain-containing protein [Acidobacteria bacterium]|nr:cupin domain-containing protein [Acidobacteriota bacterium]
MTEDTVRSALHLTPDGASVDIDSDHFWNHRAADLTDGIVICEGPQTVTWDRWERHPDDDEIAVLLSGAVEVDLDDGQRTWRVGLKAHTPQIIPAGAWHRLHIHESAQMLFATPRPSRTQQRDAASRTAP